MAMVIFGTFFGYLMANNYKVYGLTRINNDAFVTLVGSIGSLVNGASRAIWAAFYDKYGFKRVYFVLLVVQAALSVSLHYISTIQGVYLLWYALIMSCEGGQIAMFPAVTKKVFGPKVGPVMYGIVFGGYAVTNLTAFFLTNFALTAIGWPGIFWICFGTTVATFLINLTFNEKKDYFD